MSVTRDRMIIVVLVALLLLSWSVLLTGGDRAGAVDGPVDVVYVATGRNFPDALAGSTLATATGAPLLTVEPTGDLPAATVAALTALDPDRIVVLGGPAAVSDDVVDQLAAFARTQVTRLQGDDRHETAALIADALPDKVHDADLLDGRDASDFLGVDDEVDAATFGGLAPSDLLEITPALRTVFPDAVSVALGVRVPAGTTGAGDWWMTVPPWVGGTMRVDVRLAHTNDSDCTMFLTHSSLVQPLGSDLSFATMPMGPSGTEGPSSTLDVTADVNHVLVPMTLGPSEFLVAGEPVILRVGRAGAAPEDTCATGDLRVTGLVVRP